jgi:hypothetical protein
MSKSDNPIAAAWLAADDDQRRDFVIELGLGLPSNLNRELFPSDPKWTDIPPDDAFGPTRFN